MNVKTTVTIVMLVGGLSLACAPAFAQGAQGPCREDIQKFCSGVQPGGGRYHDCLQQHAADLSSACQRHVQQVKERSSGWRQACQADVQKLCSSVTAGHGDTMQCLQQHEADLSQACKDQLAQGHHPRGKADATSAQ